MDRGSVIVRQINGQKKRKKRGERLKEMLAKQGIIRRRRVKNERERERERERYHMWGNYGWNS